MIAKLELDNLTPHVRAVLTVVAKAIDPGRLTPEKIQSIVGDVAIALDGHRVKIEHRPRTPPGAKPRMKGGYVLTIAGPRFDGVWTFHSGEFEDLLRSLRQSEGI
jgi:hypothetical protein